MTRTVLKFTHKLRWLTLMGCLSIGLTDAAQAQSAPDLRCAQPAGPHRTVVNIVNAQTLLLDDGSRLRLMGILPPFRPLRAVVLSQRPAPNGSEWPPITATLSGLKQLLHGRTIRLAGARHKRDRYGRILAQVFVPPLNAGEPMRWLQGKLVAQGLARADGTRNDPCAASLIEHEQRARQAGKGLWQYSTYAVRDAARPRAMRNLVGSYQIIEGRVRRSGGNRFKIYLNFGGDWKTDFTVGIARKRTRDFARSNIRLRDLGGRHIRVRGWLEWRGGPFIRAVLPTQIEVLAE